MPLIRGQMTEHVGYMIIKEKENKTMVNPMYMTDKYIRKLARKPLGTNGKSVKITEQEIEDYKNLIDSLLFCDCRRTYAEKIVRANKVY